MSITLITGASSGIGRGLALRMAAAGETVVVMARRQALLDTLVDEIRAAGAAATSSLPAASPVTAGCLPRPRTERPKPASPT